MSKPKDAQIWEAHRELKVCEEALKETEKHQKMILERAKEMTGKDREEFEKLANEMTEEARNKFERACIDFDLVMRAIDRINISEHTFPDSLELYDDILKRNRESFMKAERGENHEPYIDDAETEGQNLLWDLFENAARNYYELYPPFVKQGVRIPHYIKEFYAESRWCYVLQKYCAAVALSRAIIELVIKDKVGIDKGNSIGSTSRYLDDIYAKTKIVKEEDYRILKEANKKANEVLHSGKLVKKKQALDVIEITKTFLEVIYRDTEVDES